MKCQLRIIAILGLLITVAPADARRRSRIDTPIQNAADAPLEDNLATASGSEMVVEKVEAPKAKEEDASKADSALPSAPQCSSDNISFELVTGYGDGRKFLSSAFNEPLPLATCCRRRRTFWTPCPC